MSQLTKTVIITDICLIMAIKLIIHMYANQIQYIKIMKHNYEEDP